jgi:hypothetical protein
MKILRSFLLSVLFVLAGQACGGSNASAPTAQDITASLKAINEKPAAPGSDGAVTVEVLNVKIGDRRKWHFADGGDGTPETDLWSVRVHYLIRTHYRTRTMVYDWDKPMAVFRNGLGEWQVGITTGASKDRSYDEPSDFK